MSDLKLEYRLVERANGRPPTFGCRVYEDGALLFDDAWVSIRLRDLAAAQWLGALVARAHVAGTWVAPPGHGTAGESVVWNGDVDDDCAATIAGHDAHAEHLSGPVRGGRWGCSVGDRLDSASLPGLEIRSGAAARWLCELVARAPELAVEHDQDEPGR